MKERYLLIGTAGHVDHGKTQLVKALTGIDTDRLKEEKERGISIELGFAHLTLPGGQKAGIVDVPGHEKFIRQMLAGASGMDLVLLVIAADEGFMPQTQEHLDILTLLKVDKGIVVITKTDLVDQEWLSLIEKDIRERLKGSFLQDASLCKVSTLTGEGITELLQTIIIECAEARLRRVDLPARMPIDRVFTVHGFGTIVTGTLQNGSLQKGQDIRIEPGELSAKIRNIQIHGEQANEVAAGQRGAINLSGLGVNDIKRGSTLVVGDYYKVSKIWDVEITNLASEKRSIQQRQRVHFYHGTAERLGRIHLLKQEELIPGETVLAQVILEEEILASKGDSFVIRYYSPVTTIGGGTILGAASYKRKRNRKKEIEDLQLQLDGKIQDIICEKLKMPKNLEEIEKLMGYRPVEISQALKDLQGLNRVVLLSDEELKIFWLQEEAGELAKKAAGLAAEYHKLYPLRTGIGREELKKRLGMDVSSKIWQLILKWAEDKSYLQIVGNQIKALPERKLPEKIQKQLDYLYENSQKAGLNPPDWHELCTLCGIPERGFQEYAAYLTSKGLWVKIDEYYFAASAIEQAKTLLGDYLKENGKATASEIRTLWNVSRKYTIAILEYFDSIRFTKREGNDRVKY